MKRRVASALLALAVLASPCVCLADEGGWPDLGSTAAVAPEGSKDAAVIVGIDEYAFVAHVPGATRNAGDWVTYLTESRHVPIDHVQLLRNVQGTREGILKAASQAAKQVQPGGTLWFVFIGHGAPGPTGSDGLLVGADAQQTADSIFARSVPQGELLGRLAAGPASAHRVLVVDACFSGRTAQGESIAAGLQPMLAVRDAPVSGATVLSAGGADQFAGPLPGTARPAFSYLVLGALRGWAAEPNGDVTASDAVAYARLVLRTLPLGRTQEPRLSGTGPAVVLARRATEKAPNLHDILLHPGEAAPTPSTPPPTDLVIGTTSHEPPRDEGTRLPGAIHASFVAPLGDAGIWTFQDAHHQTLCKLPCTRWMVPGPGYVLVRQSPIKGEEPVSVPVPPESPFNEGSDVTEQIVPPRGSLKAGILVTTVSVALTAAGSVMAAVDFSSSPVVGGTGLALAVTGGVGIILGIPMMASSHAWQVNATPASQGPLMFHFSPQGLEMTHGTTRAALSPAGVVGTF